MPHVSRTPPSGKNVIQSYVFPGTWTRERVVAWLRKEGAFAGGIEKTSGESGVWRARQYNPSDFVAESFRMIRVGSSGVRAVRGQTD